MIKHFNTAMSTGSSSGSSKGGVGTIIWIALIAAGVYFGYKYITRTSQPVITKDND